MNAWSHQPWIEALGWTLLHSLWQLSLLAALAAALLFLLRHRSAALRYLVAYIFLLLMFLAPLATFAFLLPRTQPVSTFSSIAPSTPIPAHTDLPPITLHIITSIPATIALTARLQQMVEPLLPFAATAYLAIALCLIARLLISYRSLRRLSSTSLPALAAHHDLLTSLQQRLHLRRPILLRTSPHIDVPTTFGSLRPLILLPATALTGLSEEHLRYLLLHELAHIRRHDYAANLLQSLIDTLLFYHPAVHWLSGVIRQEREHCCDDLTVTTLGNRPAYVAALASMETLRIHPTPLALGAADGQLLSRVRRILRPQPPAPSRHRVITATSLTTFALMLGLGVYLAACSRTDAPPTPPTTSAATSTADDDPTLITATTSAPSLIRPIHAGDMLEISINELLTPNQFYTDQLPVDERGTLHILTLGNIPAAGKTPRQLEDAIVRAATDRHVLLNPEVSVALMNLAADLRPLQIGERVFSKIYDIETPNAFLTRTDVIDEKGDLQVTHLGRVQVGGLTPTEAAAKIETALVDNHLLIAPAYAQVGRASSDTLEIALESRIMLVTDATLAALEMPPATPGAPSMRLLTDGDLHDLLQQTQEDPQTINTASPRITLFNGQSGEIQVVSKPDRGISFKFDATASGDRQRMTANVAFSLQKQQAPAQTLTLHTSIPNANTLLFSGLTVDDEKYPARHMIVFMRPKIIVEKPRRNDPAATLPTEFRSPGR